MHHSSNKSVHVQSAHKRCSSEGCHNWTWGKNTMKHYKGLVKLLKLVNWVLDKKISPRVGCLCFYHNLYRGSHVTNVDSESFKALASPNLTMLKSILRVILGFCPIFMHCCYQKSVWSLLMPEKKTIYLFSPVVWNHVNLEKYKYST